MRYKKTIDVTYCDFKKLHFYPIEANKKVCISIELMVDMFKINAQGQSQGYQSIKDFADASKG